MPDGVRTPLSRIQSLCWSCLIRSLRFCSSSPSDSSPSSMDSSPSSFSLGIGGGRCGVLDLLFFFLLLLPPPPSPPESDSSLTGGRCLLFLLDFFLCLLLLEPPPPPPPASESLSTMEGGDPSPDSDKSFLRFFFFGLEDWEGEKVKWHYNSPIFLISFVLTSPSKEDRDDELGLLCLLFFFLLRFFFWLPCVCMQAS